MESGTGTGVVNVNEGCPVLLWGVAGGARPIDLTSSMVCHSRISRHHDETYAVTSTVARLSKVRSLNVWVQVQLVSGPDPDRTLS